MALNLKMDMKKVAKLAGVMTLAALLLNWVFELMGHPTQELFAVSPIGTIGPGLGGAITALTPIQQLIGWMSGAIPVGELLGTAIALTFVASFGVILVGQFLVDNFKFPFANGRISRLASIIIWGWAAFYLILVGTEGLLSGSTLLGVAVFTVPLSYITAWLSDMFKLI